MTAGKLWIHFDAEFPLGFGRDLLDHFGPAGELLFVQFLCACKRSHPQGQVQYRTEDEARTILGAHYPFSDSDGQEWALDDFWRWCSYRRITTTSRRSGRRIVTASRWDRWEIAPNLEQRAKNRERMRRSRAMLSRAQPRTSRPEVEVEVEVEGEVEVEVEVEGDPGGTRVGTAAQKLLQQLEEVKTRQAEINRNGTLP